MLLLIAFLSSQRSEVLVLTALDTVTEAAGEVTETSTEMVLDVLDGVRDAATANSPALGANANVVLGVLIRRTIMAENWKSGSNALHESHAAASTDAEVSHLRVAQTQAISSISGLAGIAGLGNST